MFACRITSTALESPILTLSDNHITSDTACQASWAEIVRHIDNHIILIQFHIAGDLIDGIGPFNPAHLFLGIMMAEEMQAALPGDLIIYKGDFLCGLIGVEYNAFRLVAEFLNNFINSLEKANDTSWASGQ
jgi:hypothetical protein